MRVSTLGLALAVLLCMWLSALEASAQTVQLPTFSFASVGTTVMVPDRGSAFLGGINRASDGRSEFGVPGIAFPGFQNRGIGQDRSATSFWATATIHDFDAMDQALLNTPSPDGFAEELSQHVPRSAGNSCGDRRAGLSSTKRPISPETGGSSQTRRRR